MVALCGNGFRQLIYGYTLAINLYAGLIIVAVSLTIGGMADIYVDDTASMLSFFQFGALRHSEANSDIVLTHVGDYHEKEQYGENQIGHGCKVETWHLAFMTAETTHGRPPFSVADVAFGEVGIVILSVTASLMRRG